MSRHNYKIVLYITSIWFVISFVTNIIGPLIPIIIKRLSINYFMAGFLPFSFFLSYGIISIPAGFLLEKRGQRFTLLAAFTLNALGCLLIAVSPAYLAVVAGLFIIGLGMAMLQVVINPLTRATVGEGHFAFYAVLGQLVFGLASFLSPYALSFLSAHQQDFLATSAPWIPFYAVSGLGFLIFIGLTTLLSLPKAELADDERVGTLSTYRALIQNRTVLLYFLGIITYVGTEQSLADWMAQFMLIYHQFPAETVGNHAVSLFWGLMAVGCLFGLALLKLFDSQIILRASGLGAAICLSAALFGPAMVSLYAFPLCGFMLSVMWSIIFSLALNSLPEHHGAYSGILCTGILGGALFPLVVGWLADQIGLRNAMCLIFILLGYILAISFWARPLVKNETSWRPAT